MPVVNKVGLALRTNLDSRDGALIFDGIHYAEKRNRQATRELAI